MLWCRRIHRACDKLALKSGCGANAAAVVAAGHVKSSARRHAVVQLQTQAQGKPGDERPWDTGPSSVAAQRLEPFHLVTFFILLSAGLMFLAVLLFFTADIQFQGACLKVGLYSWTVVY